MSAGRRRRVAVTLAAAIGLATGAVRASDPTAVRLYREGKIAAQAKDWTQACKLLQESQDRDPAPSTLLNLADCEEHRGRLVVAAAEYRDVARSFAASDIRGRFAADRASSVERRLGHVRIHVEEQGAQVECDGAPVDSASVRTSVAVDPGEHVFTLKVAGRPDVGAKIRVAEGEERDLALSALSAETSSAARPAVSPATIRIVPPAVNPSRRLEAGALFGVAAIGVGVGIVSGILAFEAASDVKATCPARQCATGAALGDAQAAGDRSHTMALTSTIGFGLGAVAASAGAYLLLRSREKTILAPAVGSTSFGLVLQGAL